MSIDRYCVHCDHAIKLASPMLCSRHTRLDLVTGESYVLPCSLCRDLEKYCGTRGVYFQSKQMTDDAVIDPDFMTNPF